MSFRRSVPVVEMNDKDLKMFMNELFKVRALCVLCVCVSLSLSSTTQSVR